MRQVEIQRMEFLQNKDKTPEGLDEKETERLRQLEAKLFAEQSKGGNKDGGRTSSSAGSDTRTNSGDGDNQDGGKVGRKGTSNERANGDESNSSTPRPSGENDGVNRPSGNRGRGSRTKSVEPRDENGGSGGDSRGDNGEPRIDSGDDAGRVGGSIGERGQEETQTLGTTHLKPKTSVVPKRKKATNKKKSNELDADMISALLTSGFGLIAKATARPHWEITEDEADSVAEPMEFLIDNMTAKQKKAIEKYSNPIMLASAVAGIVVPRIMIDMALMKQSKRPKEVASNVRTENTLEANIDGGSQSNFKLGGVSKDGRDSGSGQVASPVNDSVITGLFK